MNDQFNTARIVDVPKIKNGSMIIIGTNNAFTIFVDHHFNWFQKRMIKWCFGFDVEDYSED